MKNCSRIVCCVMVVLIIVLGTYNTALAADWVWISSNARYGLFFDAATMKYHKTDDGNINRDYIDVWWKMIIDEAFAAKKARFNNKIIRVQTYHVRYDLSKNTVRMLASASYDKELGLIFQCEYDDSKYETVFPDSVAGATLSGIVKYAKTHDAKIIRQTLGTELSPAKDMLLITAVPDVGGLTLATARKIIEDAGLRVQITERVSSVQIGKICGQFPEPGVVMQKGQLVTLHVSMGAKK